MTKLEELQNYAKQLERDVQSRDMELTLMQAELIDTTAPSVAMTQITCMVADMLEENINFVKKNGMTQKAKESRERLLKLLTVGETFNTISVHNNSLKNLCKQMFGMGQALRIENLKLKQQLQNTLKAFEEDGN